MCEPVTAAAVASAASSAGTAVAGLSTLQTVGLAASAVSGIVGAYGTYQQGQTNAEIANANAKTAEYAAQDALRRADKDAEAVQRRTAQMVGAQRAGFAAKGLDISDGTPADVIDQTNFFGVADAGTARYNGKVEAYNDRSRAAGFSAQAQAAQSNGIYGAAGSLLTSAGAVSDRWNTYTRKVY